MVKLDMQHIPTCILGYIAKVKTCHLKEKRNDLKKVVYKDDIICARCQWREVCRFGGWLVDEHMDNIIKTKKCEEFKRDWNVILRKRKDIK